jgi:hypothetical protein
MERATAAAATKVMILRVIIDVLLCTLDRLTVIAENSDHSQLLSTQSRVNRAPSMGGARAAPALTAASTCPDSGDQARIAAKISAAAREVMAVNTAKQRWPIMSM